jgi:hypothetical protein
MSGYKRTTVSISPAEYKRLHEAEMKLRFMEKDLPELMNEFEEDKAAGLQEDFKQLEGRQNDFLNLLAGFDEQIRGIEAHTSQCLTNQQVEFWNSLQSVLEDTHQNNSNELLEQTRAYNDQFASELENHQQEISELSRSLIDLSHRQREKSLYAQEWIATAQSICEFISGHYDPQFIKTGQLEPLIARLNQAQQNLDYGLDEAALVSAQEVYERCSELHIELEKRQSEWEILYSTARQQTRQLYALATHSSPCHALDIEGNRLPVQIDVDFWTSGSLSKLVSQIQTNLEQLDQKKEQWNTTGLKNYLQETEIRTALENTVYQARLSVLSSQLRINIADVVVQALATQGFEIQESLYSNDDMRKSFCARLRNLEGSEVVVKISPIQGEPGQNDLHLHSLDAAQRSEHELHQRALEISQALRQYGLKVGASHTHPATVQSNPAQQNSFTQIKKPETIHLSG